MSGDFLYSAEGQIGCHQETVKGKADGPDDQIPKIYFFGIMILLQNEEVCNLDGNHWGEDRADQIKEAGNVVHVEEGGAECPDDRDDRGDRLPFSAQPAVQIRMIRAATPRPAFAIIPAMSDWPVNSAAPSPITYIQTETRP